MTKTTTNMKMMTIIKDVHNNVLIFKPDEVKYVNEIGVVVHTSYTNSGALPYTGNYIYCGLEIHVKGRKYDLFSGHAAIHVPQTTREKYNEEYHLKLNDCLGRYWERGVNWVNQGELFIRQGEERMKRLLFPNIRLDEFSLDFKYIPEFIDMKDKLLKLEPFEITIEKLRPQ